MTVVKTFTADTLEPATRPTMYFIGVTTGQSSIRQVFPLWAEALDLGDVELVGIDLPVHADVQQYRTVVKHLKRDPLSLGALVTTHKIDLFNAAGDLFDEVDPLGVLMGEVSSISKRNSHFRAHAKDPISCGHAIEAFLPAGYFDGVPTDVIIFGAGGSAIAIDWHFNRPERGTDRPRQIVVTDIESRRLEMVRTIHDKSHTDTPLLTIRVVDSIENLKVLASASPNSVVINATGLGKDAPGSPLRDDAIFPDHSVAWDLNYRGNLIFLQQARAMESSKSIQIEDGWTYFLHGWTQVISEVFNTEIPTSGPLFDRLSTIALSTKE